MKDGVRALSKLSDEELMTEYKLGDAEAFRVLYDRHTGKVYGYLSKKLYSKTQVDDVFQECFLRLHKFRAKYDASFPFLPWLFTICRNVMVDYLRGIARSREESIEGIQEPIHDGGVSQRELAESLASLPVKEGNIVDMHFLQGYSFKEVASYLKIKPSGARKISSRAIQKLKAIWKSEV